MINKDKSEIQVNPAKLSDFKLRKMYTQSSYKSVKLELSDGDTQINPMNPNEPEFHKQEVRNNLQRERSDVIKRLCNELDSANKSDTSFNNRNDSKSISK